MQEHVYSTLLIWCLTVSWSDCRIDEAIDQQHGRLCTRVRIDVDNLNICFDNVNSP